MNAREWLFTLVLAPWVFVGAVRLTVWLLAAPERRRDAGRVRLGMLVSLAFLAVAVARLLYGSGWLR